MSDEVYVSSYDVSRPSRKGGERKEVSIAPRVRPGRNCVETIRRIGGFAIGVVVVIVYYILNVACEFLVTTSNLLPFAGTWIPNGMFALATIVWFYIMSRH